MIQVDTAFTAIVLRFRDLVTAPGETIALHRQRCTRLGFTWWGWWNRADESLPYAAMVRAKYLLVTGQECKVFLLDTANNAVYETECLDIHFHSTERMPEPSPEPDATPDYYSERQYLAWFKFRSISPVPVADSKVVGSYSYTPVSGLFDRKRREDAPLENKVVASIREMKRQSRTLFFLKRPVPTDAQQEIIVAPRLQVFLCHSSNDKERVRQLYEQLRDDGFSPWLDKENLLPGQDWEFEILKAVRESDAVLVCLSRSAASKEGFIQKELRFALDKADEKPEGTIFIVPVRLEECDVPIRLSRWHYVDLFGDRGYSKLTAALRARGRALSSRLE